jgi:hypothetical protein
VPSNPHAGAANPDGNVGLWGFYPDRLGNKVAYLTAEIEGDARCCASVILVLRLTFSTELTIEGCRSDRADRLGIYAPQTADG